MVAFSSLAGVVLSPEKYLLRQLSKLNQSQRDTYVATVEGLIMEHAQFRFGAMCSGTENPVVWLVAAFRVGKSMAQSDSIRVQC